MQCPTNGAAAWGNQKKLLWGTGVLSSHLPIHTLFLGLVGDLTTFCFTSNQFRIPLHL